MAALVQTFEPFPGLSIVLNEGGVDIKLVSTESGRTQRMVGLYPSNIHEADQMAFALRKTAKYIENRVKSRLEEDHK